MDMTLERQGMFERCRADPECQASFVGFMHGLAIYKRDWTEIYNTKILMDGFDVDGGAPLLVDVGGAHGVDVERLLSRYPDLSNGKLVLQDTPDVIAMARVSEKIESMGYNFFKPQPIRGE
jgi:hypothetical protein